MERCWSSEILGRLKERFDRLKVIFADSNGRNNLPECVKDAFGWLLPKLCETGKGQRVCGAAQALDCRADVRLAWAIPEAQQGL